MNTVLRILYKNEHETDIIENISSITINGRCLFTQNSNIDIVLYETDNLDIEIFSEEYKTYEVKITTL